MFLCNPDRNLRNAVSFLLYAANFYLIEIFEPVTGLIII